MFNDLDPLGFNIDTANLGCLGKPYPKRLQQLLDQKKVSDKELHEYCLFALRHCVEHGDTGFVLRLLEMLGKRHLTKRKIVSWFCTFGTLRIKIGRPVYKKRANINKENLFECMERANFTPFYSDSLEPLQIKKLITSPVISNKMINPREKGDSQSSSVWTVSGGLPSLGKRR